MKITEFTKDDTFINRFSGFAEQIRSFAKENIIPPHLMKRLLMLSSNFLCNFWMIEDNAGKPLGHIGANISNAVKNNGYVGFFELDLNHTDYQLTGKTLLHLAKTWLKNHKATSIYGPLNYNTWFPYRFRVDDSPENYVWEPNQPREYVQIFTNNGFKPAEKYYSTCTDRMNSFIRNTEHKFNKCIKEGFTFSVIAPEELNNLLFHLYKIAIKCFKKAVLYEPIDFKSFKDIYYPLASKTEYFCVKAEDQMKNLVGYCVLLCTEDNLILKNMAVDPKYQGHGLSTALMCFSQISGKEKGMKKAIYALFHEHNEKISHLAKKEKPIWIHEYQLFKM